MAPKVWELLISSISLLLLFHPLLCQAKSEAQKGENPSPFGFLKHFQGCHRGDKLGRLHELKKYLSQFGYLNYHPSQNPHGNDDEFDDLLEAAIKSYQLNYNLKPTGTLDAQTLSMMAMPRCGVPDIVNGTSGMRAGKKRYHHGSSSFRVVSHYAFFQGSPKWPAYKKNLTYAFPESTIGATRGTFARAFHKWATAVQHFTFTETRDYTNADLRIGFYSGDHGDGFPFDGPGGILAHSFPPTLGILHCDADEFWSLNGPIAGAFDLETIALHEIGHLLGLAHSSIHDAIMYPTFSAGVSKGLNLDDIRGLKALYNI